MPELGHVAYYVRNLERSVAFYQKVVGLTVVGRIFRGRAAVLSSGNKHHELLLIQISTADGPLTGRRVGLYHAGWKVGNTFNDLQEALDRAHTYGAQIEGTTDHGIMFSLYLKDPDENEVELFVDNPDCDWRKDTSWMEAPVRPLDLSVTCQHRGVGLQPARPFLRQPSPRRVAPIQEDQIYQDTNSEAEASGYDSAEHQTDNLHSTSTPSINTAKQTQGFPETKTQPQQRQAQNVSTPEVAANSKLSATVVTVPTTAPAVEPKVAHTPDPPILSTEIAAKGPPEAVLQPKTEPAIRYTQNYLPTQSHPLPVQEQSQYQYRENQPRPNTPPTFDASGANLPPPQDFRVEKATDGSREIANARDAQYQETGSSAPWHPVEQQRQPVEHAIASPL